MIKELLLSLAVVAASGVSFVGSPKKAIGTIDQVYGNYYLWLNSNERAEANTPFGDIEDNDFVLDDGYLRFSATDGQEPNIEFYGVIDTEHTWGTISIYWYFHSQQDATDFKNNIAFPMFENERFTTNVGYVDGDNPITQTQDGYRYGLSWACDEFSQDDNDFYISFSLEDPNPQYTLTKNFVNCDIASSPRLPDNFTNSSQLTYYVLMTAAAGGYGFTSESVTQTGGITIRNFNLFDQYNNSGYYASCSFNVDLPLNNCSLSVTAFLPQYTITSTLEHCTVSPAIPSSYTGTSFSGDYTFTAESGYGFNKNYTHWEASNLFIDSVEFSALLWGSFYSSVTLHLRASGGNSSISVTAIKYDEESYKLGYEEGREDGWQAGYDRGHADGEIAGNSYGVWNWLKQAALTTGEFLSINLLPGFSIGGLLTALAGLVIIWFFIKGFLFKS